MAIDPNQYGLGGETAEALSGGVFAAAAREYLRPAVGWQKRVMAALLCLCGAFMFGDELKAALPDLHFSLQFASAIAGVICIGVAEGLLKAVDRLDLTAFFKRGPV